MQSNGTATQTATHAANEERLYRIGEVSRLTELKPFVLRYWETEFPILEPVKSPKWHRVYRQEDVDVVFKIKRLLYDEGFTIAGARRHLRENGGGGAGAGTPCRHRENPWGVLARNILLGFRGRPRAFSR